MARTEKWMIKVTYHGMEVISTMEHKIFKLPHKKVSIADYPVVDMHHVMVSKDGSDVPEDLLLAHPANPVRLTGVVVVDGKQYLLCFPGISGFSVEDGEHGLEGDCNLFALGSYRWYRICSAVKDYQAMLRDMHNEARIYWILRDLRGDWMNAVDQQMATSYPHLQDENSAAYLEQAEAIAKSLEPLDFENFQNYWRKVHEYMSPKDTPSWQKGLALGKKYSSYLINHMVVDQNSFFWTNSLLFRRICRHDINAQKEIFRRHSIDMPIDWVARIQRTILQFDSGEANQFDQPGNDRAMTEAIIDNLGHSEPTQPDNIASQSALQETDVEDSLAAKGLLKRKRSLSSTSGNDSSSSTRAMARSDKSNGWNEFQRLNRPELARINPSMSKTGLTQLLGRMFRTQRLGPSESTESKVKTPSTSMNRDWNDRGSIGPGNLTETNVDRSYFKRESSTQSDSSNTLQPMAKSDIKNFKSTIPIKRTSSYFTRGDPFFQITGNVKQACITVEILQSMIYEEEVSDVNIADVFFVLERDYAARAEKVIALISSQVGAILELLSATDRSDSTDRHRPVDTNNIWLSTTLYEQLYKLYRITDQDSNLLLLVQWQKNDIFEALELSDGIWYPKDRTVVLSPSKYPKTKSVIKQEEDLYENDRTSGVNSDDATVIIPSGRTDGRQGRSSLRPAAKAGQSKYIRNGAGPKLLKPPRNTASPVVTPTQQPVHDIHGQQTTLFIIDSEEDELTSPHQQDLLPNGTAPRALKRNDDDTVANPMPKLYPVPRLRAIRGPDTRANNAGIWRCAIPGCYFFQDDAASCTGQENIMAHYDGHASTMLERIELVGEAAVAGSGTAALVRKLEQEARQWREAMKRDAMLLG